MYTLLYQKSNRIFTLNGGSCNIVLQGIGFKKPVNVLGINPGPNASDFTNCTSYITITYIQKVYFSPMQVHELSV